MIILAELINIEASFSGAGLNEFLEDSRKLLHISNQSFHKEGVNLPPDLHKKLIVSHRHLAKKFREIARNPEYFEKKDPRGLFALSAVHDSAANAHEYNMPIRLVRMS